MGDPTVTPLAENWHDGGFIVSEANGHMSRETVTLSGATKVLAGTVLGKITATGKYVPLDTGAADGSEVAVAVLFATKDVTSADKDALIMARLCEVNGSELIWPDGALTAEITAAKAELALQDIIAR